MKNKRNLWLIVAIVAMVGLAFAMTACDNGNDDPCTHTPCATATCTTAQICTDCGTVIQAALGHDESGAAATCTTAKICARANCEHVLQAAGHNIVGGICTTCGVLRLYDLPLEFLDDTDETDFSYVYNAANVSYWELIPLSDVITGTPKAQITGAGDNRQVTIELDQPKADAAQWWTIQDFNDSYHTTVNATPSDAKILQIVQFFYEFSTNHFLEMRVSNARIELLYADRDVVLDGNSFNNVSFKKGWNFLSYNSEDNSYYASQTMPDYLVFVVEDD